ncbi:hypothetical protein [Eubacterium callanderi]|uniref:hypothetical protein n=1 Tax=Eubacterium callanderi TaxID=53442 RepID=UPI00391D62A7
MQSADGFSNGSKGRGRDLTGGTADDVNGLGGVKGSDLPEVIGFKECLCLQSAAQHEHVGHAVDHQIPQAFAQVLIVQTIEVAACGTLFEILQIVGQIVFTGVDTDADDGLHQVFSGFELSKGVLKGFNDGRVMDLLDLPERNGPDAAFIPALFGIGKVKIVFQVEVIALLVKDGDPFAARLHPASKAPIPALRGEYRGHIGALGMDQELLIEGQAKVGAGGF